MSGSLGLFWREIGRGKDKGLPDFYFENSPKESVVGFIKLDALLCGQGEVDGGTLLGRGPGEVEGAAGQKFLDFGDAVFIGRDASHRHHRDAEKNRRRDFEKSC